MRSATAPDMMVCRGSREHGLKQEIRPVGVTDVIGLRDAGIVGSQSEACETQEAVEVARIHQVEADIGITENPETDDKGVLEQDVDCVFLLCQPAFQCGKTQVHDEYQAGAEHHPQIVGREDAHGDGAFGCSHWRGVNCRRVGGGSFRSALRGFGVLSQGRCGCKGDGQRQDQQQGWQPFGKA